MFKVSGRKRIAVIGGGISGVGAAKIMMEYGYSVVLFEKSPTVGGVWLGAYPNVHIQNTYLQYKYSDFDWPFIVDYHPTGQQILEYLQKASIHYNIDVRLNHEVLSLEERPDGWLVFTRKNQLETNLEFFDFVVVCTGLFNDGKYKPNIPGSDIFQGQVITEREIINFNEFKNKNIVVYGYGKSALDVVTTAAVVSKNTYHVFRSPRWTLPERLFGIEFTFPLYCRFLNMMISSWVHPTTSAQFFHTNNFIIYAFWAIVGFILRLETWLFGSFCSTKIKHNIAITLPSEPLMQDRRSLVAILPKEYYPLIVAEKIVPIHGQLSCLNSNSVTLIDGSILPCDICVLSLGNQTPSFTFLPQKYRLFMEREGGAQLYRHIIHPRIPRLGFIGFNHSFLHIPSIEVSSLWLSAIWSNDLILPSCEKMEKSIHVVSTWKNDHVMYEPTRSYLILTRFQQYLDTLLQDLGLNPYRKLPNLLLEWFGFYDSNSYQGCVGEFLKQKRNRNGFLTPIESLHT